MDVQSPDVSPNPQREGLRTLIPKQNERSDVTAKGSRDCARDILGNTERPFVLIPMVAAATAENTLSVLAKGPGDSEKPLNPFGSSVWRQ